MVTLSDHVLPSLAVIAVWFASTALIVWLANRPRATYRSSLRMAAAAGAVGLAVLASCAHEGGPAAAYASFLGGLAIWGWHELAFLTGAAAGPRRQPATSEPDGWRRFVQASSTVIHHEMALAATALLLLTMTAGASNKTGALAFALLFGLRLSAKLNIHCGVPNLAHELLPCHLGYLKTYFRRRPISPLLSVSVLAWLALAAWLGSRLLTVDPGSGEAVEASLLFALAALGALEHLFLALPLRDGALYRWAIPARSNDILRGGGYGL